MRPEDWDQRYRAALGQCLDRYESIAVPVEDWPGLHKFIREFREVLPTYPLMKLNRWLGYIQGVIIGAGYATVEEERDWTRPLFRPLDFE